MLRYFLASAKPLPSVPIRLAAGISTSSNSSSPSGQLSMPILWMGLDEKPAMARSNSRQETPRSPFCRWVCTNPTPSSHTVPRLM
ncbi:hypothetical protein G6F63_016892 [Rhizopus arrhizus]|nr:hypothetical protein G6F63_016892 [Rhizopus arrhizus]